MGNARWAELIARHNRILRRSIKRFGGSEIDTAGDGFFVTFERPGDAIRCAVAAVEAVRELGIEIRAAVAFGELEAADRKPGGLVVNMAARIVGVAGPGEVLVPAAIRDILPGAGVSFEDRGLHRLRGLEGEVRLSKVAQVDGSAPSPPLEADEAARRRIEIFPAERRSRGRLVAIAAAVALMLVVVTLALSGREVPEPPPSTGPLRNAIVRIDPFTGEVVQTISLARSASAFISLQHPLAAGAGGVWLLIQRDTLLHVDPKRSEVENDRIKVQRVATDVQAQEDVVWVAGPGNVARINPATDEVSPFLNAFNVTGFAVSDAVWVGQGDGYLIRAEPYLQARDGADTGVSIDWLAASRTAGWIGDVLAGAVYRVDPRSLRLSDPIPIEGRIDGLAADDAAAWVLDSFVGAVRRIPDHAELPDRSARVGEDPTDMAIGLGWLWVADGGGSLYRVDTTTLAVKRIPLGAEVLGISVDRSAKTVWAYVGEELPS
jgi:streptogramin lyase